MANSIMKDKHGPVWPLGNIIVAAAGTPVNIMSLVDSTLRDAPETGTQTAVGYEFTNRAQQIIFQAFKAGAGPPSLAVNTGNIYIIKKGGSGSLNATDKGAIIAVLTPGQTFTLASAPLNRNVFSPYEYYIDADTTNDACQVTLIIQ